MRPKCPPASQCADKSMLIPIGNSQSLILSATDYSSQQLGKGMQPVLLIILAVRASWLFCFCLSHSEPAVLVPRTVSAG